MIGVRDSAPSATFLLENDFAIAPNSNRGLMDRLDLVFQFS
jgi:hypothetical protein